MLKVQTDGPVPVHIQLREQVKNLIATGQLEPGEQLPSATLLGQSLGINRNTVLRAYHELQEEGIVASEHGRGTFVTVDLPASIKIRASLRQTLAPQLNKLIEESLAGGMTKDELLLLVTSQIGSYTEPPRTSRRRAVFVECNPDRLDYYCKELERALGMEVLPLLIDVLSRSEASARTIVQQADLVVAPFFHFAEVRSALQKLDCPHTPELVGITIRPHLTVAGHLAALRKGTKVAILYYHHDSYCERMMANLLLGLERMGLPIDLVAFSFRVGETDVAERLEGIEVVVVQPENIGPIAHLIPPRITVVEWANELDQTSIDLLSGVVQQKEAEMLADGNASEISV